MSKKNKPDKNEVSDKPEGAPECFGKIDEKWYGKKISEPCDEKNYCIDLIEAIEYMLIKNISNRPNELFLSSEWGVLDRRFKKLSEFILVERQHQEMRNLENFKLLKKINYCPFCGTEFPIKE